MRPRKSVCACRPQRCFAADSEAQYSTESPLVSHLLTCNSGLFQLSDLIAGKFVCCLIKFGVDVLCPRGDCAPFCEI